MHAPRICIKALRHLPGEEIGKNSGRASSGSCSHDLVRWKRLDIDQRLVSRVLSLESPGRQMLLLLLLLLLLLALLMMLRGMSSTGTRGVGRLSSVVVVRSGTR